MQNQIRELNHLDCDVENCEGVVVWDDEKEIFICNQCKALYQ